MTDAFRDMPRYIRNTDAFGWQGADDPNGPWRSITPPQSRTPWKTTNAMDGLRQSSADVSGVEILSPAAQAVMIAATNGNENVINDPVYKQCIAAALRAAADQVVPDLPKPSADSDYHLMNWSKSLDQYYQRQQTRAELLAIAAELLEQLSAQVQAPVPMAGWQPIDTAPKDGTEILASDYDAIEIVY